MRNACAVGMVLSIVMSASVLSQSNSGALDLRLPIGARATALGGAYAAEQGSEAIWWNPAGLAVVTKAEFGLDHFSSFQIESGDAVSIILPAGRVGTYGISARLFNYGSATTTTIEGEEVGKSSFVSYAVGGSFASTIGKRVNGGLSFRLYNLSVPCTGLCQGAVSGSFSTATVDVGVQFKTSDSSSVRYALLLSNLGPQLQIRDGPQADALPARMHASVSIRPSNPAWDRNLTLCFTGEVLATPARSAPELRLGGEVGYSVSETAVFARGGYPILANASEGSGPSIGIGLSSKRVQFSLARVIETFSTNLGKPPTYISIRVGL